MIATGDSTSLQTRDRSRPIAELLPSKRACLTSEEHRPAFTSNFPVVQYRYFESADILSVYLREVTSGLIVDTWDVHPGLLVDFDHQERPVALNISSASCLIPVHFYETCEDVDGKPPLQLGQMYDPYSKVLMLRFCTTVSSKNVGTSDGNIMVLEDDTGNWVGLRVTNIIPPVE